MNAKHAQRGPLIEEIPVPPAIEDALKKFAAQPAVLLLESCLQREHVGRYSFLTADPFELIRLQRAEFGVDPFQRIRQATERFTTDSVAGLPPFQGGAAGLLSYDLGHCWEKFPRHLHDDFRLPAMAVGLYDW
ncbi:MAG: aminodeoxychorismate synthase, component I, partial [Planctomycetes bacterium]|nr:aminodeoxychorismate synthase, component I [Planctomycetota bacterium]